ncbi:MAG: C25 family cysteine peptidase, partial [Patescibacteria group bacterium]|nr:C25 family cysteine peptidase [Patescibacteria group bacterium]
PLNDNQLGVCAGARKICGGTMGWINDYSSIPNNEYPTEISCDGLDNNCDGTTDEVCNIDGDNYCDCGQTFIYGSDLTDICSGTNTTDAAAVANTCDCNDTNISINPAAAEICDNSIDDDCDTDIDCADTDCIGDLACVATCSDGTTANNCSTATGKPWYCDNTSNLVENCAICGCAGSWICGPAGTFCCDDQCNSSCSSIGCTVAYDPDCGCQDGDGCCGIGCDNTDDSDCPLICTPDGCNANCPAGCTVAQDGDCGCQDSNGCCGIGCDSGNDNDCAPICTPNGCNGNCPTGCGPADDPDCSGTGCCGDNNCDTGEDCLTCPNDCGVCPNNNIKLLTKYSNKEVFLISDNDWKNVLPLVPVSIWTEPDGTINKYPALVYHDESGAIDVDSTIHFMQLYPPSNLTTIGSIPVSLTNLLAAAQPLGAGMDVINDVDNISTSDYFSYWSNYNDVVYVQDDYELALLASTYASLINAPLVIEGTGNDTDGVFTGKNIICVGSPPRSCDEQYNLDQIQDKYVQVVNSVDSKDLNKIIVTNPNDWVYSVPPIGIFNTDKSEDRIQEVFSKHSLSSPFLASAKHELILTVDGFPNRDSCNNSNQNINCSALRDKIKQKVESLNLSGIDINRKHSALNIVLYDNGEIKQVQDSYYGAFAFFINNNKIVWLKQDKIEKIVVPGEYSIEDDYTLKSYDILTEQTEILYSFGKNSPSEMAMHDNNIVWSEEDMDTGIFTIILFDINTKTTQIIYSTTNQIMGAGGQGLLINNNYIIWNEEIFNPITFEQTNILNEFNISTTAITQLYSTIGKNMYINLTDSLLAWQDMDFMAGTQQMYYMKFSDHNNIAFHNPINNIVGMSLNSDIIAWKEWDTDHYVFHKYDVITDVVTNNAVLLPQNYFPNAFILYNNKIYMYGSGANDKNVIAYDIDTGQKQDITDPATDINNKVGLAIHSDRIIWSETIKRNYMFKDGYITIIGGPEAIPYFNASVADKQMFASIYHGNYFPDLAYGRIVGLTSSDASSYINRAIFFNDVPANNKVAFFASESNGRTSGTSWLDNYACPIFGNSGYTVSACVRHYGIDLYPFNSSEAIYYEDADFIYYYDHGSLGGINISYQDLPYMNNIFINTMACSTAQISMKNYNFALMSMRKGAIAYMGAVQIASIYPSTGLAHSVYHEDLPIGFAFIKYISMLRQETLLGDPTLKIGRTLVNQPLILE